MIDSARPYAELLYPLVDPLHDLLTEAYIDLLRIQGDFPRIDGSPHKLTKVNAFKGFILEKSPNSIGGFRILRTNGASVSFVHEVHGLTLNLRRPEGLNRSTEQTPNLIPMPAESPLFERPTPRQLLLHRRPGPNDLSALTWNWPTKGENGDWRWNLKFLLTTQGHTLDEGLWALGLKLPREAKLDDALSGFQPEEMPLEFLADQGERESGSEA